MTSKIATKAKAKKVSADSKVRADKLMKSIVGGGVANRISRAFDLMEIAEQEIASECSAMDPETAKRVKRDAFGVLRPGEPFQGVTDSIYRMHARELIARVSKREDTRPGTKAEVLIGLCQASLKAPLTGEGQALAETLWLAVFPATELASQLDPREAYPGATEQALHEARRRCRVEERVVTPR
jgi:hypothetical protein